MNSNHMKKLLVAFLLALPLAAAAHQPRLVETEAIDVVDPEVSKAYYGRLDGAPHVYRLSSETPFRLYVNLLVPDVPGVEKDLSAAVIDTDDPEHPLAVLGGPEGAWEPYHEEFANDDYFRAEEFIKEDAVGSYEVRVWSTNDQGPYSLAIGEKEEFPPGEIANAVATLPKIKSEIFGKPWYEAYLTKFVLPLVLVAAVLVAGAVAGVVVYLKRRKPKLP